MVRSFCLGYVRLGQKVIRIDSRKIKTKLKFNFNTIQVAAEVDPGQQISAEGPEVWAVTATPIATRWTASSWPQTFPNRPERRRFPPEIWSMSARFAGKSSPSPTGWRSTWPRGTSRGRRTAAVGCRTCATSATGPSPGPTCWRGTWGFTPESNLTLAGYVDRYSTCSCYPYMLIYLNIYLSVHRYVFLSVCLSNCHNSVCNFAQKWQNNLNIILFVEHSSSWVFVLNHLLQGNRFVVYLSCNLTYNKMLKHKKQ